MRSATGVGYGSCRKRIICILFMEIDYPFQDPWCGGPLDDWPHKVAYQRGSPHPLRDRFQTVAEANQARILPSPHLAQKGKHPRGGDMEQEATCVGIDAVNAGVVVAVRPSSNGWNNDYLESEVTEPMPSGQTTDPAPVLLSATGVIEIPLVSALAGVSLLDHPPQNADDHAGHGEEPSGTGHGARAPRYSGAHPLTVKRTR